jgi:DNA-binding NtrC family response regulator
MPLQEARKMMPSHSEWSGRVAPSLQTRDVRAAARCDVPVLLTGRREAVEALAYRIHSFSNRRYGPFSVVDCSAPERLVECLLFNGGREIDSPVVLRPRLDRRGNGGTVLLQDIGKLSLGFQAMLAERFGEIRGLGKHEATTRRMIASTAEALWPRVEAGTFDDRLFYRLNVMHLVV